MFKQTNDAFLALSIALSVKTIYYVTLKCITLQKPFFPFTTRLVMMSWIVVTASLRVLAIVLFLSHLLACSAFWDIGKWNRYHTLNG